MTGENENIAAKNKNSQFYSPMIYNNPIYTASFITYRNN